MTRYRLTTPSRLHFGLLGWGPQSHRQFGGVGLMIDEPWLELTAEPAEVMSADGPHAPRILEITRSVVSKLRAEGREPSPIRFRIDRAPAEHVGLGLGTQLSLSVARILCAASGESEPSIERLAPLTGRGRRSGIGLHGFAHGGLIVDGGRRNPAGIPPLLCRMELPADWSILVVQPPRIQGLHGAGERHAFESLPPIPETVTDRLCRLVLLGLLPAVQENDLETFGAALERTPASGGPRILGHPGRDVCASRARNDHHHPPRRQPARRRPELMGPDPLRLQPPGSGGTRGHAPGTTIAPRSARRRSVLDPRQCDGTPARHRIDMKLMIYQTPNANRPGRPGVWTGGAVWWKDSGDDRLSRQRHYHGPDGLNGRVRNGNGCDPAGILAGNLPARRSGRTRSRMLR